MKITKANLERGMTLVELLVVIVVLALIVAMLQPYSNGQSRAQRINCVNNIRQIEMAMATWSADHSHFAPVQLSVTNDGTKELIERGLAYVHFQVMSNELTAPKLLVCPADKLKVRAASFGKADFSNANISYFISVDAIDLYPGMLMIGDRNLTLDGVAVKPGLISLATNSPVGWTKDMHVLQGNIGLADGSVQQVNAKRLSEAMQWNGTNRWVVP